MSEDNVNRRIPEFKTLEEEAAWFDTHDVGEYWGDFSPVSITLAPGALSESAMSVRLPQATLARLRQRAARKGVGHTTLVRMWIIERLEEEERSEATVR